MPDLKNLLTGIPPAGPQEHLQTLLETRELRIERIVSHGQTSHEGFWYDQPHAEWVLLVSGRARLRFEDGQVMELSPGSFVNVPAHQRHRVDWTDPDQPTVWLAIHYREGQVAGNEQQFRP